MSSRAAQEKPWNLAERGLLPFVYALVPSPNSVSDASADERKNNSYGTGARINPERPGGTKIARGMRDFCSSGQFFCFFLEKSATQSLGFFKDQAPKGENQKILRMPPGHSGFLLALRSSAIQPRFEMHRREKMPRPRKAPTAPFRPLQVVSPVPSKRRYGRPKIEKKMFDIYVINIETGEEMFAITVMAPNKRQAIQTAKNRLRSSPLLRDITYAAFIAVEVEAGA
jgi:hypothetical protein